MGKEKRHKSVYASSCYKKIGTQLGPDNIMLGGFFTKKKAEALISNVEAALKDSTDDDKLQVTVFFNPDGQYGESLEIRTEKAFNRPNPNAGSDVADRVNKAVQG